MASEPGSSRWSTWSETSDGTSRGPYPRPDWLITEGDARDVDHGVVKSGKEASLHLVERYSPGTSRRALMGAKRYVPRLSTQLWKGTVNGGDRLHRGGREKRALARMSRYGQFLARSEWAQAEFEYLCRFHEAGVPVPYPVQIWECEILMEWIGDESGTAASRLVDVDLGSAAAYAHAADQVREAMVTMARLGFAHGDLSAYNILVEEGQRIRIIDLPQVVDIAKNPQGAAILERDCRNVVDHFTRHGVTDLDADALYADCLSNAWS